MGRQSLKHARRLLADCRVQHAIPEVQESASLAGALQALIAAHVMEGGLREPTPEEVNALIAGLASAVGWLIASAPPDSWEDGLTLLADKARAAARAHRDFRDRDGATVQ